MKIREIHESDDMTGFEFFQDSPFPDEYVHIILTSDDNNVWCYVWNLDSVAEAEGSYIEIQLFEVRIKDQGHGTRFLNTLKRRYKKIGVHGSENDRFWKKNGFRYSGERSDMDGAKLMIWKSDESI